MISRLVTCKRDLIILTQSYCHFLATWATCFPQVAAPHGTRRIDLGTLCFGIDLISLSLGYVYLVDKDIVLYYRNVAWRFQSLAHLGSDTLN